MTYTSTYLLYMITHVSSKTNHQNIRMHVFLDTKCTNLHSHLCVRFEQRNPEHIQKCIHGPAVSSRLYINKDYCYSIFSYTRTRYASSYLQIRIYTQIRMSFTWIRILVYIYRDQIHGPAYACSR